MTMDFFHFCPRFFDSKFNLQMKISKIFFIFLNTSHASKIIPQLVSEKENNNTNKDKVAFCLHAMKNEDKFPTVGRKFFIET